MTTVFLVVLGVPFISVSVLDPGGITSSTSINGCLVSQSNGSKMGAFVFMIFGIMCLVGAVMSLIKARKK